VGRAGKSDRLNAVATANTKCRGNFRIPSRLTSPAGGVGWLASYREGYRDEAWCHPGTGLRRCSCQAQISLWCRGSCPLPSCVRNRKITNYFAR